MFDEPFFKKIKSLHDEYGAKFSLYTYNSVLKDVPNIYAEEFNLNSEWLKIGFHSESNGQSLVNATYEDGITYWNKFVSNVYRICGTYDSIDRIPRLEYFAGSYQCLLGMKDARYGALGFLSADDSRLSYYFDDIMMEYLYENDYYIDTNNLIFFSQFPHI